MSLTAGEGVREGIRDGARVTVRVPATSANLGPGFDSLGLALRLHDVVSLTVRPAGPGGGTCTVEVDGEGAGGVPRDERHLVVRAVRALFDHAGVPQPDLELVCRNAIPHGRGLGSSAAAVVAGLVAARACLAGPVVDDDAILTLADRFEGHPDNAAAALLGGGTVSWRAADGSPRAVRIDLHPELDPVVLVPGADLSTERARAMLPAQVPHADAAFNAGRAALLVEALTRRPDLLPAATEDRLHQAQRAAAMPGTADLLARIRAAGGAAVVSGAGPSLLVPGVGADPADAVSVALGSGSGSAAEAWKVLRPGLDTEGAIVTTEGELSRR